MARPPKIRLNHINLYVNLFHDDKVIYFMHDINRSTHCLPTVLPQQNYQQTKQQTIRL